MKNDLAHFIQYSNQIDSSLNECPFCHNALKSKNHGNGASNKNLPGLVIYGVVITCNQCYFEFTYELVTMTDPPKYDKHLTIFFGKNKQYRSFVGYNMSEDGGSIRQDLNTVCKKLLDICGTISGNQLANLFRTECDRFCTLQ